MDRIAVQKSKARRPASKSPIATKGYTEKDLVPIRPQQEISDDRVITLTKCASLAIPQFYFESNGHQIAQIGCTDDRDGNEELRICPLDIPQQFDVESSDNQIALIGCTDDRRGRNELLRIHSRDQSIRRRKKPLFLKKVQGAEDARSFTNNVGLQKDSKSQNGEWFELKEGLATSRF